MLLMPGRSRVLRDAVRTAGDKIHSGANTVDVLSALDKARGPMRAYFRSRLHDSPAATALTLKLLNLLLAKQQFLARSTQLLSRPFGLLVDPSNGCNLACPGCVQSTRSKSLKLFDWKNGLLSEDRFAGFLENYGPCGMQIMFCNYGEPITNPHTPRLIEMAKGYYAQTALSTNLALPRFDAEAYVRSRLDFMFLAIDGATQPVYARYRKNGDIDAVYRNVENLVTAKRRLGSHTPILRWQFLAFEHNAHEIEKALAIAKDLGVDQFVADIPFDVSWDDPDVHPASDVRPIHLELIPDTEKMLAGNWADCLTPQALERMERQLDRGWMADRNRADLAAMPPDRDPAHTCSWLYKSTTLDANGRILPCAGAPKTGTSLVFANLGDGDPDGFNSPHYRQARLSFANPPAFQKACASGGPTPHCLNCEWDQDHTEFGAAQVAQYLRTAGRDAVDPASIDMCSNW